ncbi:LysR substrate-binding domain-containing protein [Vibrio sp. SS-MA-C1-2]|uniref:LysR family transcriptional regulator n=1 Tax=Vibrio sp. SS-MA-C1-2 TaxID=2908646 RepID=UPI001F2E2AD9|nr:LysR family transcriptional regulator [Vibrio sp. SS-MA-C1-2]UJF18282.1 LysR substrate-binding domain-containing protein [Vibrio sp. SS-MA-C1-2]
MKTILFRHASTTKTEHKMDLKSLNYFIQLVETRNFTRASELSFVSQPTISKAIKSLENEFGEKLIHKSGRQIELTSVGELVYQRAMAIQRQSDTLKQQLADLKGLNSGTLSIGIPPMVGYLFADLIFQFRQKYPNIQLKISEYGSRRIEQELKNGELDLGVSMLPLAEADYFSCYQIFSYPIRLVVPNKAHWQQSDTIMLTQLKAESFCLHNSEFALSDIIESHCLAQNFKPQVSVRSSQWDFLAAMVEKGMGITFLPEPICHKLSHHQLLFKTLSPTLNWDLGLIWGLDRYLSHSASAFLALAQQEKR